MQSQGESSQTALEVMTESGPFTLWVNSFTSYATVSFLILYFSFLQILISSIVDDINFKQLKLSLCNPSSVYRLSIYLFIYFVKCDFVGLISLENTNGSKWNL